MIQPCLNPVRHVGFDRNRYCGPAALSAIAGITTGEAARLSRKLNGRTCVRGMSIDDMVRNLAYLGIRTQRLTMIYYRTVASVMEEFEQSDDVVLMVAGNHWCLIQGPHYVCGWTHNLVPRSQVPCPRRHVTYAAKLVRFSEPGILPPAPVRAPFDAAKFKLKQELKALLARYPTIFVDEADWRTDQRLWVGCHDYDDEDNEADPFNGEHIVDSWQEALDQVKAYAAIIAARQTTADVSLKSAAFPTPK